MLLKPKMKKLAMGLALFTLLFLLTLPSGTRAQETMEEFRTKEEAERIEGKININTASQVQLETLPGIGSIQALAIIGHRPYERIEALRSVPGIGTEKYQALKDLIAVEPEEVEEIEEIEKEKIEEEEIEEELSPIEKTFVVLPSLVISREIRQFGYDIFRFPPTTFAPVTAVPVGPDYTLGPGDTLIIYLWGPVQESFEVIIDRDGKVPLPKAGIVHLWGLSFSQAQKLISRTLTEYYANFRISVTMGSLRTIKVFVLGELTKPGGYTISSLSTLFHSLYEAGGPTKLGSLRQIKLIRKNKTIATVDLYRLLLKGDKSQDRRLQSGDTIFVPRIGPVAGIAGYVKKPAIYEMKGRTRISDLLEMSGGITPIGYLKRVQVERIEAHQRKVVVDLELKSLKELKKAKENIVLEDGDLVLIFPILPRKYNFVSIEGNVSRPGDYELLPGMRISDLIEKAEGVLPECYLERAEIFRFRSDRTREIIPFNLKELLEGVEKENLELKEWDRVVIYAWEDVIPTPYVEISGAVRKPGEYELTPNMRLSDLIFRGGGLEKAARLERSELYRIVLGEYPKVMEIDLKEIMGKEKGKEDLLLEENDHLFIREEAKWTEKKRITLSGEVKYPGVYVVEKDERLSSVLKRAGDYTEEAFLFGAIFTRESLKEVQMKMINRFIRSEEERLLKEEISLSKKELSGAKEKYLLERLEYRKRLIELVSSIEVPGRMIIKLSKLEQLTGSKYDVALEDGDSLHIPPFPAAVQVLGEIYNPSSIVYEKGKGIEYYLGKVGGLTKDADKKEIHVIKASGEVESRFVRIRTMDRGDTIVVPVKFRVPIPGWRITKDIIQMFYQMALGVAVVVSM